jgi:hypothetical protein
MCILGKDKLKQLIENYKCIYPYDYTLLDGDGYILTVKEETTLNYLEHKNLITHEIVCIPPNMVAHLTAKSKYGRMGLSFLNAAKVHSGFIGRLALDVPDPVLLGAPEKCVEALAVCLEIVVQYDRVHRRVVLLGDDCLLGRGHTADRGTILVIGPDVTRADTLNPGDAPGFPAIGTPQDTALEGP